MLGLSVAACGAAALALTARPAHALAHNDTQALRFLEELEAMQADFFTRAALSTGQGMEGRERDVINLVANQDREQKEWFRLARQKFGVTEFGTLFSPNASQSRPVQMFRFEARLFESRRELFPAAHFLKDTAVGIYHYFVGRTSDAGLTEALAALAGIEGRHAAALREIAGVNPVPEAFEPVVTAETALRRLERFGFRGHSMR
jgi:hypothetical protein